MVANVRTGIWMCRAKEANILVMDVEGTDGRERGEDQVGYDWTYESKNKNKGQPTTI
jgi:protein SEY1